MKGVVLGYDPATSSGAISGEDNARYDFAGGEWKGGGSPTPGARVDFEVRDGKAVGIYPAVGAAAPQSGAGPSIDGGEIGKLFMSRPAIIAAILMILGCLFPVFSVGLGGIAARGANIFDMTSNAGNMGGSSVLFYLFWAVPILAGVVLYFEFAKKAAGGSPVNLRLASGAVGIGMVILLWIVASSMASNAGNMGYGINIGIQVNPSIGAFVIIAGGALMLLNALNVVKSFGGAPQN